MSKEEINKKISEPVKWIDELTDEQWTKLEAAREQIKNGEFHTYEEVKTHFAKLLSN